MGNSGLLTREGETVAWGIGKSGVLTREGEIGLGDRNGGLGV